MCELAAHRKTIIPDFLQNTSWIALTEALAAGQNGHLLVPCLLLAAELRPILLIHALDDALGSRMLGAELDAQFINVGLVVGVLLFETQERSMGHAALQQPRVRCLEPANVKRGFGVLVQVAPHDARLKDMVVLEKLSHRERVARRSSRLGPSGRSTLLEPLAFFYCTPFEAVFDALTFCIPAFLGVLVARFCRVAIAPASLLLALRHCDLDVIAAISVEPAATVAVPRAGCAVAVLGDLPARLLMHAAREQAGDNSEGRKPGKSENSPNKGDGGLSRSPWLCILDIKL